MRRAEDYQATQNYPLFKGYLEHFNSISIDNENYLIFIIQNQLTINLQQQNLVFLSLIQSRYSFLIYP